MLPSVGKMRFDSATPRSNIVRNSRQVKTYELAPIGSNVTHSQSLTENHKTFFQRSQFSRPKYFWVSPDWLSEVTTARRMKQEKRADPMQFGWM